MCHVKERFDVFQASEYYLGYKNHDLGYDYYQGNNYNLGYKHNLGHDL